MAEHGMDLHRVDDSLDNQWDYEQRARLAAATDRMPSWHRAHEATKDQINGDLQRILVRQLAQFNAAAMRAVTVFIIGRLTGTDMHPPAATIADRGDVVTVDALLTAVYSAFEGDLASVRMSPEKAVTAVREAATLCVGIDEECACDKFALELYRRIGEENAIRAFVALTSGVVPDNRPYMRACPDTENIRRWFVVLEGDCGAWTGQLIIQVIATVGYPDSPPYFYVMTPSDLYDVMKDICVSVGHHHKTTYRPGMGIEGFMNAVSRTIETVDINRGIGINDRATIKSVQAASKRSHAFNAENYPQVMRAINRTSSSTYENMFCAQIRRIRAADDERAAAAQTAARQASLLGPRPARGKQAAAASASTSASASVSESVSTSASVSASTK